MRTASACSACNGSGKMIYKRPPGVGADGLEKVEEIVSVKIPPGVQDGMQLRVARMHAEAWKKDNSLDLRNEVKCES